MGGKPQNPRISIRLPLANAADKASTIDLTANSASLATSCGNRSARMAIKSDRVMAAESALRLIELGLQQRTKIGRPAGSRGAFRLKPLQGILLLCLVLGTHRQID